MDSKTNLNELKEKVKLFCEERDWDQYHGPKDLAIGIITEASELLEHFRFKTEDQSKKLFIESKTRKALADEIADILFFILRLSQRYNVDLSSSLSSKMRENEQKYPVHKSKGSNKKYTEL